MARLVQALAVPVSVVVVIKMNPLKIYIAGPISGIENGNKEAFDSLEREILNIGFSENAIAVLNPMSLPLGLTEPEYMDICFAMVRACDVVFFLEGWQESLGAQAEYTYARKLGKELVCHLVNNGRTSIDLEDFLTKKILELIEKINKGKSYV